MSLLASPIFFFLARLAHRLARKHLGLATQRPPSFNAAGADI